MVTRAPCAVAPRAFLARKPIQLASAPRVLRNRNGAPSRFTTTRSTPPSSSRSPPGQRAAGRERAAGDAARGRHGAERLAPLRGDAGEEQVRLGIGAVRIRCRELACDAAVGDVEVPQPVAVEVGQRGAEAGVGQALRRQPEQRRAVGEAAALVAVQRVGLATQVRQEQVEVSVLLEVGDDDAHPGLGVATLVQRAARDQRAVLEPPAAAVDPELVGRAVVRDVHVDAAVAVEVAEAEAQAVAERGVEPGARADVLEGTVSAIGVQAVGQRRVEVDRGAVVCARLVDGRPAIGLPQGRPADVARDEQVEVAVAVEVEEAAAGPPSLVREPGCRGRVLEGPVAAVEVQHVGAEVRDEQVGVAVAVDVPARRPHPVAGVADARPLGDVLEAHAAEVPVQAVARQRPPVGLHAAALDEVEVEAPVAVGVEHGDASADGLREPVAPVEAGFVHEVDAGPGEHVFEPDLLGGRRLAGGRVVRAAVAGRESCGDAAREPKRSGRPHGSVSSTAASAASSAP